MSKKNITLALDAYEKLRLSKRPGESFSDVVRRAQFDEPPGTGASLLEYLRKGGSAVSDAYLDEVEAADRNDKPPDDPWAEAN